MNLRMAKEQIEILQDHIALPADADVDFLVLHAEILLGSLRAARREFDAHEAWPAESSAG